MRPVIEEKAAAAAVSLLCTRFDRPIEVLKPCLVDPEINNRAEHYPRIAKALRSRSLPVAELRRALNSSWALRGPIPQSRLGDFTSDLVNFERHARALLNRFPDRETSAADRIDAFVDAGVQGGYQDPRGKPDRAGAALLASVLLSSVFPRRFADYQHTRWQALALTLDIDVAQLPRDQHGRCVVFAGQIAHGLGGTPTFQRHWPGVSDLWAPASFCWALEWSKKSKNREAFIKGLDEHLARGFPEGAEKEGLHKFHERNGEVVRKAKEAWRRTDARLPCEVCGFSFVEQYGVIGEGFIEAHHRVPLSEMRGPRDTRVKDLAPVCANCHRVIHLGRKSLTIEQARRTLSGHSSTGSRDRGR